MHSQPIVRAVDVGYGNTKYTLKRISSGQVECGLFPSIAPQASLGPDLSGGVFQHRNTHIVQVEGVRYEVGSDARLAQDASYARMLDTGYSLSDTYLALVRGALAYIGLPRLDLLVLGLPVNTFETHHEELVRRMKGSHVVPGVADGRVEVAEVTVLPQPIGGFFDHAIRNNLYGRMKGQTNLVIDPGFYTLDWVVARGVKMMNARSGAHSGGMSAVLAAMSEAIGRKLGTQITDPAPIDDALRTGTNPRFFGREFELSKFIGLGKTKARQFAAVLANKVGNGVDIDNIILVGGGAEFFRDVMQDKFPNHEITVAQDAIFANARGFQFAGEQLAAAMGCNAARAGGEA